MNETFTLYKLMILYLLKKVKFPLAPLHDSVHLITRSGYVRHIIADDIQITVLCDHIRS